MEEVFNDIQYVEHSYTWSTLNRNALCLSIYPPHICFISSMIQLSAHQNSTCFFFKLMFTGVLVNPHESCRLQDQHEVNSQMARCPTQSQANTNWAICCWKWAQQPSGPTYMAWPSWFPYHWILKLLDPPSHEHIVSMGIGPYSLPLTEWINHVIQ